VEDAVGNFRKAGFNEAMDGIDLISQVINIIGASGENCK